MLARRPQHPQALQGPRQAEVGVGVGRLEVGERLERLDEGVEAEFDFEDPVIDGKEVRYWGGFAFPKGADDLREAVNQALEEEKRYGDWEQVLSRYGFLAKDIIYSYRFDTESLCQAQG